MTKADRAKMRTRFIDALAKQLIGKELTIDSMIGFTAKEVDRAVRNKRKAQRDSEELWASHRRRADEQMIERAKGLERKRS